MEKHLIGLALTSQLVFATGFAQTTDHDLADLEAIAVADTMLMVPMRDGVRLATDVYYPKDQDGPFPVVLVKTPYNFNEIGGTTLQWAVEFIQHGYAFVVQNERGRYYSEGDWEILGNPRTDGYDSISWLAE